MSSNSFYNKGELKDIGFKSIGENVLISKKASFYSPEKMKIGNNVRIDDFTILSGEITLGSYIHISAYTVLYGALGIELKNFSGISARGVIYSAIDDFGGDFLMSPMPPKQYTKVDGGKVIVERYVQIGANSIVMPNLTIGEGSVLGAFSFVNKSIESWGIYAGIPVTRKKDRKKNLLKHVKEIESGQK